MLQVRLVDLSNNKIGERGFSAIFSSLENIQELKLRACGLSSKEMKIFEKRMIEKKQKAISFMKTFSKFFIYLDLKKLSRSIMSKFIERTFTKALFNRCEILTSVKIQLEIKDFRQS